MIDVHIHIDNIVVNFRFTIITISGSTYAKLLHQVSHKLNTLLLPIIQKITTKINTHDYIIESDLYTTLHY